jgi:UDP-N-acetylglucosamine 2-epimerase (non-hydrolysing)
LKKKVLLVFGTRPEAIKMIPIYFELIKNSANFEPIICLTGQHKELIEPVLKIFNIKAKYDLAIMKKNQDLFSITSDILVKTKSIFQKEKPDIVLVHGDTTTSISAALSAFYLNIPVGHIEAGLRSFNNLSPFPEELNRKLTAQIATLHFSPTKKNKKNLLLEGIGGDKIHVVGNTGIDSLKNILKLIKNSRVNIKLNLGYEISRVHGQKRMILVTGHRRENFGAGFENILKSIKFLTEKYPDVDFVYPMHLNPNIREPILKLFGDETPKNLYLIEPLDYFDFVNFMQKATLILTDSGGVQEEAPSLGKPVLVMRENTERPEGINLGTCRLVGTDQNKIITEVSRILEDDTYYKSFSKIDNPYGDGNSSKKIINILMEKLF